MTGRDSLDYGEGSNNNLIIELPSPILDKWSKTARKKKRMHAEAFEFFNFLSNLTGTSTIAITTISGMISIVIASLGNNNLYLEVTTGSLSIFAGGLLAVNRSLGFERKAELHNEYSTRYAELVRDIHTEAALRAIGNGRYISDAESIKVLQCELDKLDDKAPYIPAFIEQRQ